MDGTRTLRIFWDDPDATDSSGDDDRYCCSPARRVHRMVREIALDHCPATSSGGESPPLRRGKPCGKKPRQRKVPSAAGAKKTTTSPQPDGVRKFAEEPLPTSVSAGYESGEESRALSSPTSVLRCFPSGAAEAAPAEEKHGNLAGAPETSPGISALHEFVTFEDVPLYNDFLAFEVSETRFISMAATGFALPTSGELNDSTPWEADLGSASWQQGDDYFGDMADLFPLEPLPAMF